MKPLYHQNLFFLMTSAALPLGLVASLATKFPSLEKLALPSILGNLADPLIYMLGLGYGLGKMLRDRRVNSYVAFLAAGTVCASTMNAKHSRFYIQPSPGCMQKHGMQF